MTTSPHATFGCHPLAIVWGGDIKPLLLAVLLFAGKSSLLHSPLPEVGEGLGVGSVFMTLALVHDWLNQRGGAEDVLETLVAQYPDSPVYTSLYAPDLMPAFYRDWDIRTLWRDGCRGFTAITKPTCRSIRWRGAGWISPATT